MNRIGRVAALVGVGMTLAVVVASAQAAERAERNVDARRDSAARRTGTTVDETDKRLKKRQDKAKFQAVVPKKKGPLEPN